MEWCERGDEVIVRRASKYSSLDIHEAVFGKPPTRRSVEDMDEGIRSTCGARIRAIDTNVLVRLIVRDDPEQVARAEAFVEHGAWISLLVLAETVWVD